MNQTSHSGYGSIGRLKETLADFGPRAILLVTGRESFTTSGAADLVRDALARYQTARFCDFCANPQLTDVHRGIAIYREAQPDVVLAIGGGSVVDTAKLIALLAEQEGDPIPYIVGDAKPRRPARPLIAVPTTAGAGSEATKSAVIYHVQRKHSVAHSSLLPAVAIVDPVLSSKMNPRLTAITGLDALSQAIESYWSVKSTQASLEYSRQALERIIRHLVAAVHRPTSDARAAMAEAANLAGKAINIAQTTASHGMSYGLTAWFGVPHGQAVAATLPDLFLFNSMVTDDDSADPRGAAYVRARIGDLCSFFGCSDGIETSAALRRLINAVGLHASVPELGIHTPQARARVMEGVSQARLVNNPRRVDQRQLDQLLGAAYSPY